MAQTAKMLAAKELLGQRFHGGVSPRQDCMVILDLVRYVMQENPIPAFMRLPGFHITQSTWIRPRPPGKFQGWGRAHWFQRTGTNMKFCIESEPREPFLAAYAVTMFADDDTGLLPEEVYRIRELMLGATLTVVEVAIDFSMITEVNRTFVRRHGVFGKSRRDLLTKNTKGDWWGAKGSGKRVKSYQKDANASHRVEPKMRRRFLKPNGIEDLPDFHKFADLLPEHHIFFASLDKNKLETQLRRTKTDAETVQLLVDLAKVKGGLTEKLAFLRNHAGLTNTRRLLKPHRVNGAIRDAFNVWGALWPR